MLDNKDGGFYIIEQQGFSIVGSQDEAVEVGDPIRLDATTQYSLQRSASVTVHPVSSGADRADHYSINGDIINVSGVITNSPTILSSGPQFGGELTGSVSDYGELYTKTINRLIDEKIIVMVYMESIGLFYDCMVVGFNPEKNVKIGDGIRVNMTIQRILPATAISEQIGTSSEADRLQSVDGGGSAGGLTGSLPDTNGIVVLPL